MGIIIECSADTISLAFKHTLELVWLGTFLCLSKYLHNVLIWELTLQCKHWYFSSLFLPGHCCFLWNGLVKRTHRPISRQRCLLASWELYFSHRYITWLLALQNLQGFLGWEADDCVVKFCNAEAPSGFESCWYMVGSPKWLLGFERNFLWSSWPCDTVLLFWSKIFFFKLVRMIVFIESW